MNAYRLLAVDIDGTLVNSRDELTPATRAALKRADAAGLKIVLATGRRYSRTLPLVAPLGIRAPLVTASGALVKEPLRHQTLYAARFDERLLCRVAAIVEGGGYDPLYCGDTYAEGFDFYYPRQAAATPQLAEYLSLNPDSGRICPSLACAPPAGVFAAFTMASQQQMLDLEAALHAALPGQLHTHVLRSPRYVGHLCEIAPAGVTKWAAIQRLADGWGIAREEICAVGDDVNDIPMIREAGLGVAMGNALPAVKEAARRIAPCHDSDGLVEVVGWLLEERPAAVRWTDCPTSGPAGNPSTHLPLRDRS